MGRPSKNGAKAEGVQNKNGMLYLTFNVSSIKDGKKTNKTKWVKTGLKTTRENINKAILMRNNMLAGMHQSTILDPNITFKEFIPIFLEEKKLSIADTTYAAYLHKAKHIETHFENVKVKQLREMDIIEFLDQLFIVNDLRTRTVKDIKTLFALIMDFAILRGLISDNPVKKVTLNRRLAAEHESTKELSDTFFSYKQANLFLNISKEHELYPLFHTTLCFGLRREEVLGIKWNAIDLDNGILRIQHTVTKGTTVNRRDATKTASSRRKYPMAPDQIEMFKKIKETEKKNREKFGKSYKKNDYVFKHEDGSLYYPEYPSDAFKKIVLSNSNLPQSMTFHGLRASCVSILVHQGFDVKSIQQWVGHKTIETTLKYYAKSKEMDSKIEILGTMIDMIPIFTSGLYLDNEN